VRAQGIAAESPQDLHKQIRGLGAESPVFLPACGQKNASGNMKKKTVFILVVRKYLLTLFENRDRVSMMITNRLSINLLSLLGLLPAVKAGKGTGV
jgi:hypothetical protein